jgi:hypothetical protein
MLAYPPVLQQGPTAGTPPRFHDVDNFEMHGFNHQNSLYDLSFGLEPRGQYNTGEELPPYLTVEFGSSFGMAAKLKCVCIEVVDASPATASDRWCGQSWSDRGQPSPNGK